MAWSLRTKIKKNDFRHTKIFDFLIFFTNIWHQIYKSTHLVELISNMHLVSFLSCNFELKINKNYKRIWKNRLFYFLTKPTLRIYQLIRFDELITNMYLVSFFIWKFRSKNKKNDFKHNWIWRKIRFFHYLMIWGHQVYQSTRLNELITNMYLVLFFIWNIDLKNNKNYTKKSTLTFSWEFGTSNILIDSSWRAD